MTMNLRSLGFLFALAAVCDSGLLIRAGTTTNRPAGHWEGSIQLPGTTLNIRVDLESSSTGALSGTIDIPAQGLRGFKLDPVTAEGSSVRFSMPGVPGNPTFSGQLQPDNQTLAGDFTQGAGKFRFTLERRPSPALAPGATPASGLPGKGLAGFWQASLRPTPVIELRLALEITNAPGGQPGGVMVSLDQGNARIPLTLLREDAPVVRLETASVGGKFIGTNSPDGSELVGAWSQGGRTLPLVFKRTAAPTKLRRPQEPVPPFPYREESVTVTNASAKVTLAGTLTLPKGAGPHPAAILITGSGPQDRDESLMGHRPFLVLADHLARQGIAVLRCDDRGIGSSKGSFATATGDDFVSDAEAQFAYLRGRPEVDPRRVGFVGHSEGGIVAPRVAAGSSNVAFVVLLAGVGVPMDELLVRQGQDISRVMGMGEDQISQTAANQRETFRLIREERDPELLQRRLRELMEKQLSELTPDQQKALGWSADMMEAQIQAVLSPWFRQLLAYDPQPTLAKVRCPVLALNGEKDLQVSAEKNLPAIRTALEAGGNPAVKTVALPGLNHLFQHCETGAIAEYGQIEETFAPEALQIVSDWIRNTTAR